jgi:hypothetical protein
VPTRLPNRSSGRDHQVNKALNTPPACAQTGALDGYEAPSIMASPLEHHLGTWPSLDRPDHRHPDGSHHGHHQSPRQVFNAPAKRSWCRTAPTQARRPRRRRQSPSPQCGCQPGQQPEPTTPARSPAPTTVEPLMCRAPQPNRRPHGGRTPNASSTTAQSGGLRKASANKSLLRRAAVVLKK